MQSSSFSRHHSTRDTAARLMTPAISDVIASFSLRGSRTSPCTTRRLAPALGNAFFSEASSSSKKIVSRTVTGVFVDSRRAMTCLPLCQYCSHSQDPPTMPPPPVMRTRPLDFGRTDWAPYDLSMSSWTDDTATLSGFHAPSSSGCRSCCGSANGCDCWWTALTDCSSTINTNENTIVARIQCHAFRGDAHARHDLAAMVVEAAVNFNRDWYEVDVTSDQVM